MNGIFAHSAGDGNKVFVIRREGDVAVGKITDNGKYLLRIENDRAVGQAVDLRNRPNAFFQVVAADGKLAPFQGKEQPFERGQRVSRRDGGHRRLDEGNKRLLIGCKMNRHIANAPFFFRSSFPARRKQSAVRHNNHNVLSIRY